MPAGANKILDERTMADDNRNLLSLLKKGMNVLDVGCGSGAITKIYNNHRSGWCCYGVIDISEELIGIAKERHAAIGNIFFSHRRYL